MLTLHYATYPNNISIQAEEIEDSIAVHLFWQAIHHHDCSLLPACHQGQDPTEMLHHSHHMVLRYQQHRDHGLHM